GRGDPGARDRRDPGRRHRDRPALEGGLRGMALAGRAAPRPRPRARRLPLLPARPPLRALLRVRAQERAPGRADARGRLLGLELPRRPQGPGGVRARARHRRTGAALSGGAGNALPRKMALGLLLGAGLGVAAHLVAAGAPWLESLIANVT